MFKVTIKLFLTLLLLDVMNTLIYHIFTCDLWLINSRFTIIAIETIFKTENSIKIFFIKKTIHQRFVFFPTEHMRTLISKEMKHSIITLLQMPQIWRPLPLVLPDKELEDSILTENSLPKNFMKVLSLDVFIRDTMTEKRLNHELTMDSVLEKMQGKTRDVFGPLSRVWSYLHEVTSSDHEDEDESI